MSLEEKYKDFFKEKSSVEFYDLLTKFKMFVDVSIQESLVGSPDDRIKNLTSSFFKLRDTLVYELSRNNNRMSLNRLEEDYKKFKELNVVNDNEVKKNLEQDLESEKDQ